MKLVVQIPCLDEADLLPETLRRVPRRIPGIDRVEVLVIDDGSTDGTAAVARTHGADHLLRFPAHRGLAHAFRAGVDRALQVGADLVVNLDADAQYDPEEIPRLIGPILRGEAEIVIGEREFGSADHFSRAKRCLQRLGSWVVRRLSWTRVADAASGFRAFSREAALRLNVTSDFTYTLETILQAGCLGLPMAGVPVRSRPVRRRSRLFRSVPGYLRRSAATLLRVSTLYRPVRAFLSAASVIFAAGALLLGRFLYYYLQDPARSGHTQSLVLASILFTAAFGLAVAGLVAYLVSINRRLLEDLLVRVKRLEMPPPDARAAMPAAAGDGEEAAVRAPLPAASGSGNGSRGAGRGAGRSGS